ncbi:MAG: SPOR domain-containing protein [Candidatus Omnitrophota bacterium]|nr:SPOR domain-containing protein [Candidatus Omnitrophota bacterium]
MEAEKYQKELFEFESPKRPKARFGSIFSRTDFAITLTPEKVVFAAIGIIMLMVVFFALGVEKGRSAVQARFTAAKTITKDIVAVPAISAKPTVDPIVVSRGSAVTNITPKIGPPIAAAKTQVIFDKTKPYTVIAGAFSRQDLALKEVGKLKTVGLEAYIYYGEPYYLACVGSFQSRASAQKILKRVKQMHKDAYVRLR